MRQMNDEAIRQWRKRLRQAPWQALHDISGVIGMKMISKDPIVYQDDEDQTFHWIERKRKTNLKALAMGLKVRTLRIHKGKVFFKVNAFTSFSWHEMQRSDAGMRSAK